jgi:YHS domain-containing protein
MKLTFAILAVLWVALASPSPAFAQGNGNATTPSVALKGYDVVAYFADHHAKEGSSGFQLDFDGQRYYFSSAQNRATFSADPDRYAPQFGGYCAMGISAGKKFEADPTLWKIVDGKLYVFSSPKASDSAAKDPEILNRARQNWEAMK